MTGRARQLPAIQSAVSKRLRCMRADDDAERMYIYIAGVSFVGGGGGGE